MVIPGFLSFMMLELVSGMRAARSQLHKSFNCQKNPGYFSDRIAADGIACVRVAPVGAGSKAIRLSGGRWVWPHAGH
jgi:hypothetical protein